MSKAYVSKARRERVSKQARSRCGYCLISPKITGMQLDKEFLFQNVTFSPSI